MYNHCPFCGDTASRCEPNNKESYVRCQTCSAEGPTSDFPVAGMLWDAATENEQTLTREQAIKRIRDIRKGESVEHLNPYFEQTHDFNTGAVRELMAIFDIKEEEL